VIQTAEHELLRLRGSCACPCVALPPRHRPGCGVPFRAVVAEGAYSDNVNFEAGLWMVLDHEFARPTLAQSRQLMTYAGGPGGGGDEVIDAGPWVDSVDS
jgi:hypothetical protein